MTKIWFSQKNHEKGHKKRQKKALNMQILFWKMESSAHRWSEPFKHQVTTILTENDSKYKWPLTKRINSVFSFILFTWNRIVVSNMVVFGMLFQYVWQIVVQVPFVCKLANKGIKHFCQLNFPLTCSTSTFQCVCFVEEKYFALHFFFSERSYATMTIQQQKCVNRHFWGRNL